MLGPAQAERAAKLWKSLDGNCRLDSAEGRRLETPEAVLSASPPLSHGPDGTDLGYVVALTITDRREGFRFVHASDVQGPLSPVATAYLIRERPNLLYLSGPPAYLEARVGAPVIEQGIANLARIIDATGCRVIMDHYAVRDADYPERFRALWESGRVVDGGGLSRARRRAARVGAPRTVEATAEAADPDADADTAAMGARIEERVPLSYDESAEHIRAIERRGERMSEAKALTVGDVAPDFTLKTIGLKEISLKDYRGKTRRACSSTPSTGRPVEAPVCPPSTSASATSGGEYPGSGYQHGQSVQSRELGEVGRHLEVPAAVRCPPLRGQGVRGLLAGLERECPRDLHRRHAGNGAVHRAVRPR